jgi:hypothetical protein
MSDGTEAMSTAIRATLAERRARTTAYVPEWVAGERRTQLRAEYEQATAQLAAAEAVGDALRIDHASRQLDAVFDRAREQRKATDAQHAQTMAGHAGARSPPESRTGSEQMSDAIREAAFASRRSMEVD